MEHQHLQNASDFSGDLSSDDNKLETSCDTKFQCEHNYFLQDFYQKYTSVSVICESCVQPLTQHPTGPKGHYDKVLVIGDWNYI